MLILAKHSKVQVEGMSIVHMYNAVCFGEEKPLSVGQEDKRPRRPRRVRWHNPTSSPAGTAPVLGSAASPGLF